METDRKELDESKQMPAGTQSTDPGGDAEAQVDCRLRNDRAKQQDVKTNNQQWYRAVPDVYNVRKGSTNLLRMQQLCSSLR